MNNKSLVENCRKRITNNFYTTLSLNYNYANYAESDIRLLCDDIERLEAENAALREQLAAAMEDIRHIAPCTLCKHNGKQPCENEDSGHEKCFEWRGGQEGEEE